MSAELGPLNKFFRAYRTEEGQGSSGGSPNPNFAANLSQKEIERLRNYKWRYGLEARGFSPNQAGLLIVMKLLRSQGKLGS